MKYTNKQIRKKACSKKRKQLIKNKRKYCRKGPNPCSRINSHNSRVSRINSLLAKCKKSKARAPKRRSTSTRKNKRTKSNSRSRSVRRRIKSKSSRSRKRRVSGKRSSSAGRRSCKRRSASSKRKCKSVNRKRKVSKKRPRSAVRKSDKRKSRIVKRKCKTKKSKSRKSQLKKTIKKTRKDNSGFLSVKGIGPSFKAKLYRLKIKTLTNLKERAACATRRAFSEWLRNELCASQMQICELLKQMTFLEDPNESASDKAKANADCADKKSVDAKTENAPGNVDTAKPGYFNGFFGAPAQASSKEANATEPKTQ